MDLFREISENKFVLVVLSEKKYEEKLGKIIKNVGDNHKKICYVCLSKPYSEIESWLQNNGLNINNFLFIDVLTSHYQKQIKKENCIFVEGPDKLVAIQIAISRAISEMKCSIVIFDTLSSLMMYEQSHDVLRFTHNMTIEEKHQNINKLFVVIKEELTSADDKNNLVEDVQMIADKTIILPNNGE